MSAALAMSPGPAISKASSAWSIVQVWASASGGLIPALSVMSLLNHMMEHDSICGGA